VINVLEAVEIKTENVKLSIISEQGNGIENNEETIAMLTMK
jgi:hypothetical protein